MASPSNTRPLSPDRIRQVCRIKAGWSGDRPPRNRPPLTDPQWTSLTRLLSWALHDTGIVPNNAGALIEAEDAICHWIFDVSDADRLSRAEASALLSWIQDPGAWRPGPYAATETGRVLDAARTPCMEAV